MKISSIECIFLVAINFVLANCLKDEEKVKIFNNIVVNMIEDCYPALASVLVYGEHLDGVAKDLHQLERVNLVLQQKSSSEEVFHPIDLYRSIESVIIIENSTDDIAWIKNHKIISLMKIKTVFILDISDENCTQWNTFNIAWIFGTSSAFHICIFSKTHQKIITYNPINEYVPPSWIFKSKFTLKNYSPASIFYRNYTRENMCRDLEFDRTKILNGHTMNAIVTDANFNRSGSSNTVIHNSKDFNYSYGGPHFSGFFVLSIMQTLNISLNLSYVPFLNTSACLKNYTSLITEWADFSLDLFSQYGKEFDDWKYIELAYPLLVSNDYIVTHNRGICSPLEKIFSYYGYVTIISTSIILSITFGVIYRVYDRKKDKTSFSFFESLRLLINNPLQTRLKSFKIRIFFSVVFFYFLIIHATFSGRLTSFLTKPDLRQNVRTIDDLGDPRYAQIYARYGTEAYFANKTFVNKVFFRYENCWDVIEKNKSVACVDDFIRLVLPIAHYKLHHTEKISFNIWSLPLRKNWILKPRAHKILMRLDEAGLSKKKWVDLFSQAYQILKKNNKDKSLADYYRAITFNDLSFIFIFLLIGLFMSFLSFLIEITN